MPNLHNALKARYGDDMPSGLSSVLLAAYQQETISYDEINAVASSDIAEILLFAWNWKLLIPQGFSRCGEWDNRRLLITPGEVYEMPNVSRHLVRAAVDTGKWDIRRAVASLYQEMEAPPWEKMADLVAAITRRASHYTIRAAAIHAACLEAGIKNKTGAMIAILKGGGIISPKLAALLPGAKSGGPLYEINPSVYPPVRPGAGSKSPAG